MKTYLKIFCFAAIVVGGFFTGETGMAAKSNPEGLPKRMVTITNESPVKITRIYLAVDWDKEDKRKKVTWRELDVRDLGGNNDGQLDQDETMEVIDLDESYEYIQIRCEGLRRDEEVEAIIRRVRLSQEREYARFLESMFSAK